MKVTITEIMAVFDLASLTTRALVFIVGGVTQTCAIDALGIGVLADVVDGTRTSQRDGITDIVFERASWDGWSRGGPGHCNVDGKQVARLLNRFHSATALSVLMKKSYYELNIKHFIWTGKGFSPNTIGWIAIPIARPKWSHFVMF